MLRFNNLHFVAYNLSFTISIHLMLRFNIDDLIKDTQSGIFQYILCCGSTTRNWNIYYFLWQFQYILCCGSTSFGLKIPRSTNISIHLMLRFNEPKGDALTQAIVFQYILCCGSTNLNLYWKRKHQNFNTSYVAVQLICYTNGIKSNTYFNTSYVAVQQMRRFFCGGVKKISIHLMLRFNHPIQWFSLLNPVFQYILCCGSTEWEQRTKMELELFQYILCCGSTLNKLDYDLPIVKFQYILCCGSTLRRIMKSIEQKYFNTSYVAVQQPFLLLVNRMRAKFQYILCCGSTLDCTIFWFVLKKFQYILCCGSTSIYTRPFFTSTYFNTSYVAVQRGDIKCLDFFYFISIHLMLRFNFWIVIGKNTFI